MTAVVVGAGPAGLSCAAHLRRRGRDVVVLEQGDGVGASWRARYRALRLNSGRAFSAAPGLRFPRTAATFPTRDEVVDYLEAYRARHDLEVRTGVEVTRLDPAGTGWRITTGEGALEAQQVVVATGLLATPVLPEALDGTSGDLPVVHSAYYDDAGPYRGKSVLVVGPGCSGMEIAHDLVAGGAERVLLSVRTPPNILPRAVGGLPGDPAILVLGRVPTKVADAPMRLLRRLTIGDLADQGLPTPDEGPFTRLGRDGDAGPSIVDPEVVADLRAGRIRVVAAVEGLRGRSVRLVDGTCEQVDAVIAATGFRSGLERIAGHLGVLDEHGVPRAAEGEPAAPGLWFVNFAICAGLLRAAGRRGRRTARAIVASGAGHR